MRIIITFCLLIVVNSLSAQKLLPLSSYLSSPRISKTAKNFYKKLPAYNKDPQVYYNDMNMEKNTSSIMDSVYTKNASNRAFYLYLVNRNLDLADGSLQLLSVTWQYKLFETNAALLFRFFADNPAEKKKYQEKWISGMVGFYGQYAAGKDPSDTYDQLGDAIDKSLNGQPGAVKRTADEFMKQFKEALYMTNIFEEKKEEITVLKEADAGKTYSTYPGAMFQVSLRECRGCASSWKLTMPANPGVKLFSEEFINPSCTNCTGGNHDHLFTFNVVSKGTQQLVFRYFDQQLTFTIEVK